jgi:hypothetical protein
LVFIKKKKKKKKTAQSKTNKAKQTKKKKKMQLKDVGSFLIGLGGVLFVAWLFMALIRQSVAGSRDGFVAWFVLSVALLFLGACFHLPADASAQYVTGMVFAGISVALFVTWIVKFAWFGFTRLELWDQNKHMLAQYNKNVITLTDYQREVKQLEAKETAAERAFESADKNLPTFGPMFWLFVGWVLAAIISGVLIGTASS